MNVNEGICSSIRQIDEQILEQKIIYGIDNGDYDMYFNTLQNSRVELTWSCSTPGRNSSRIS